MFKSIFKKSDSRCSEVEEDYFNDTFEMLGNFEKQIRPKLNLHSERKGIDKVSKTDLQNFKSELVDQTIDPIFSVKADLKDKNIAKVTKFINILELRDREFEEWCLDFLNKNYYRAELTQQTNDKGIDIKAIKEIKDCNGNILYQENIVCQCKGYAQSALVGSPEIRNFLGSMVIAKVRKGYFFTNTRFSEEANNDVNSAKDQGFDIILFDINRLT